MDSRTAAVFCLAACLGSGNLPAQADSSSLDQVSEQVAVTFFTEPANASLYSPSGGLYGATPLTLYYELPPKWDECVQLEPLQAVWVSGADAEVALTACPDKGNSQHYTFERPEIAGVDLDEWFAQKVDQLAMVEDPVDVSRNPAHAATVESLGGNLISCSDHHPDAVGC
ncbi:MAG: hypothetical protein OES38_04495 [Gammaproteobacteria bacterium]|nr:hypothetical protein [Gammaproteobacteria bacterium]